MIFNLMFDLLKRFFYRVSQGKYFTILKNNYSLFILSIKYFFSVIYKLHNTFFTIIKIVFIKLN
jgi:hypothetical protein